MNDAEKTTIGVTLAVHEEILVSLLARALKDEPPDKIQAMRERMQQGPMLNPNAPQAANLDEADKIAGYGIEYHEVIDRIFQQALALSGR